MRARLQRIFTLPLVCVLLSAISAWAGEKPSTAPSTVDLSRGKHLFAVAEAHLDTNFNWTIQDTIRQGLPDTLHRNFELIEKNPHYVFNLEGAFRYALIKEYYPQDYARLKEYIARGQWAVCGSHVDALDVNIPGPESLIRQFLYGNGYFRREFGRTCSEVFLPDCFGFPFSLPTIEAHCGLRGFSTQKLTWGATLPFVFGRWEGVDGSSVAAALDAGGYSTNFEHDPSADPNIIGLADELGAQSGVYAAYRYFGTGDFGGSPTDESPRQIEQALAHPSGPLTVHSATAGLAFESLTAEQLARLPHYAGELLLPVHSTGCYTILSQLKRWNRRNEVLADAAERAAVAADWLGGADYPKEQLHDAWWRFLQNQDHNTMAGASIPEASPFLWNDQAVAMNQFTDMLGTGVGTVARALDTRATGVPVVVFNPVAGKRRDVVDAVVRFPGAAPAGVCVLGPDGQAVPAQLGESTTEGQHVLFTAEAPSVGYAVYDVQPVTAPMPASELQVSETGLDNARYRVQIDDRGDIASIIDKQAGGRELLAAPIRLQMLEDNAVPQFRPWRITFEDVSQPPRAGLGDDPGVQVRVVERGPARVAIEIVRTTSHLSTVIQTVRLAAGGETVKVETRLSWNDRNTLLKAAFPLAVANPEATYDLGVGTIRRGSNNSDKYEVPAQQWTDLTAPGGDYDVAILTGSRIGWDKPADNMLRLTLLHAPPAGYFPHQATQDFGTHRLSYAIAGHSGGWAEGGVPWLAARLNQPLLAFQVPAHTGKLGRAWSLLRVDSPQVMVKAVKQAEDGHEVVVRVQELAGRPASGVKLACAAPIVAAREVTGQEDPLGPASVRDGSLVFDLKAYQPRAFALRLGPPPARLKPALARPLPLAFDTDLFSRDGEHEGGDLDGQGTTLPGIQLPAKLVSGGIPFMLGGTAPGQQNALIARGQRIELPRTLAWAHPWQRPNRAYVLACAVGGDRTATFYVDGQPVTVTVGDALENLGAWEIREGHSYLKQTALAWVGTHRNRRDGTAEPYRFGYLHRCAVPLPAGARVLTLPEDDRIRVVALTVTADPAHDTVPAGTLLDPPLGRKEFARPGLTFARRVPENPAGTVPGLNVDGYTFEQEFRMWWLWGMFADAAGAAAHGPAYWALQCRDAAAKELEKTGAKAISPREIAAPEAVTAPRPEKHALRLTGYLTVPADGTYRFALRGADASQLFIGDYLVVDNNLVVDNEGWTRRMKEQDRDEIPLQAGTHAVTVFSVCQKGEPGVEVLWQRSGGPFEPIPPTAWTHLKK